MVLAFPLRVEEDDATVELATALLIQSSGDETPNLLLVVDGHGTRTLLLLGDATYGGDGREEGEATKA